MGNKKNKHIMVNINTNLFPYEKMSLDQRGHYYVWKKTAKSCQYHMIRILNHLQEWGYVNHYYHFIVVCESVNYLNDEFENKDSQTIDNIFEPTGTKNQPTTHTSKRSHKNWCASLVLVLLVFEFKMLSCSTFIHILIVLWGSFKS